jgi:hypothetical protein
VADVSFTPTFRHVDWVDRVDRAEAGGPNGFNVRFTAIGADLGRFTTVVSRIRTELDAPASTPAPVQDHVVFTPAMNPIEGAGGWGFNETGFISGSVNAGSAVVGLTNLVPPDGVRLTSLRVVGAITPIDPSFGLLNVSLLRTPLRLTSPPPAPELMAAIDTTATFGFDEQKVIAAAIGLVNLNDFRYLIRTRYADQISGARSAVAIEYIQLNFTAS